LNRLKDPNFAMPVDTDVEEIKVKSFTVKSFDGKLRITLDCMDDKRNDTDELQEYLHKLPYPANLLNIIGARFFFQFKERPYKGAGLTATIQLNYPNSHTFADKPFHSRSRKYLQQWGILKEYDETISAQYSQPTLPTATGRS
jgi:hypothetical protein